MKNVNRVWLALACLLLISCSQGDSGKGISVADLEGQYRFELKSETESERTKQDTAVKDKQSLFTIGPNYIAFGDDRQQLDQISVREIDDEKYLVLKVADTEMSLKIIDKETLFLKQGSALGIFTRVK
ncbi:hypothetical protein [Oceanisphaera sp. W20_SRM_FM3]|uniref:hypothetical protein n=1 Tax=Oceanisphaera sp. W20_SRM_FM3 TaxID=3240267 RepID=UPI003F94327E